MRLTQPYLLWQFAVVLMPLLPEDKTKCFKKATAFPNTHTGVTTFLKMRLSKQLFGPGGPTSWLPRSPHLMALDFSLWDFVKDMVYVPPILIIWTAVTSTTNSACKNNLPVLCGQFFFFFTLDAGLLARSQYSEGPATDHLDTGFLGFHVPKSKCWAGSQDSKLPLHASHVALPT